VEHKIILGGEQFLPFARSCVAKLKKLGLPYADQSFEVEGASIKVRVEPGHEYIRIEGGPIMDYLLLPASSVHPNGALKPRALARLVPGEKGIVVSEDIELLSGRHDWVSKDGRTVITYNHGSNSRYNTSYDTSFLPSGEPGIYMKGKKTDTTHPVSGVAVLGGNIVYASLESELLRSRIEGDCYACTAIVIYQVGNSGAADTEIFRLELPTSGELTGDNPRMVLAQNVFFSGDGRKFITVVRTVRLMDFTDPYIWGGPYYLLRCSIVEDPNTGVNTFTVSYETQPTEPDIRDTVTNTTETTHSPEFAGEVGDWQKTYSTSRNVTLHKHEIMGADITSDGDEKIIVRRTENYTYQTITDMIVVAAIVPRVTTTVGETRSHSELYINGVLFFTGVSSRGGGTSIYRLYRDYPETLTTIAEELIGGTYSIYELDARTPGVAAITNKTVVAAHTDTITIAGGSLEPPVVPVASPVTLKVEMYVKVLEDVGEKVIFSSVVDMNLPAFILYWVAIFDHGRRVFASRRLREYISCLSISELFVEKLSVLGQVNGDALIMARRKEKTLGTGVIRGKFTLSKEQRFRLDSVDIL